MEVRRKGLRSMRRLLPRMQLAGYASAVLHPLIRVVDGPTVRRPVAFATPSCPGFTDEYFRELDIPEA